jgi:hypothetical protein
MRNQQDEWQEELERRRAALLAEEQVKTVGKTYAFLMLGGFLLLLGTSISLLGGFLIYALTRH